MIFDPLKIRSFKSFIGGVLLLFLVSSCSYKEDKENVIPDDNTAIKENAFEKGTAVLINRTGKKIDLYYLDRYNDVVQIFLDTVQAENIFFTTPVKLIQSNRKQPFFLLNKSDTFSVVFNDKGTVQLLSQTDSTFDQELNFFSSLMEYLDNDVLETVMFEKKHSNEISQIDSFYLNRYYRSIKFLDSKKMQLSKIFFENAQRLILEELLMAKMAFTQRFKNNKNYSRYFQSIDSVLSVKNQMKICSGFDINTNFQYEFLKYKYSTIRTTTFYRDTLFEAANKIINEPEKIKTSFLVVKEEIQKNKRSKKNFVSSFITDSTNGVYKEYIENELLDSDPSASTLLLSNLNKRQSFSSVLAEHKGKVIYIDFWASWCIPCRREMPASALLRNKYKPEELAMIYLSTDKNVNTWKEAIKKENISKMPNYLISGFDNSDIKKQYNIMTIPRYFLIDKKGKVVYADAPRPSSPDLIPMLNKFISERHQAN